MSPRRLRGLWSKRSASVKAYKAFHKVHTAAASMPHVERATPLPHCATGTICWCSAGTGTFRRCLGGARSLRCYAQDRLDSGHPCCCCFGEDLASSAASVCPGALCSMRTSLASLPFLFTDLRWMLDVSRRVKVRACNTYLLPLPAEHVHVGTRLVSQACVE